MAKATNLIDMNSENNNDVVDFEINLSQLRKKRIRIYISDEESRILELNTSDVNIVSRLDSTTPKLEKLAERAQEMQKLTEEGIDVEEHAENFSKFAEVLTDIDNQMRELVDYVFQSNVSEICASDGSMFDPLDGKLRYEIIIQSLTPLYQDNFTEEEKRVANAVNKHMDKYVGNDN